MRQQFFILCMCLLCAILFLNVSRVMANDAPSFDSLFAEGVTQQVLFRSGKQYDGHNNIRIPAICATQKGTLLAFAEGRTGGDAGKLSIILRRSEDDGKTWNPIQTVWEDGDNSCGNPAPVLDESTGTIWLFGTWNKGSDHEGEILDGKSEFPRIPYLMKSDDDGLTWSKAVAMPSLRQESWGWYATGPCHGIQLQRTCCVAGRLVIPANHSIVDAAQKGAQRYRSHIIYSDDQGLSWKLGGIHEPLTNESTVVELSDGSLMQNMRSYHGKGCRAVAISRDGGVTFPAAGMASGTPENDAYLDTTLKTPVCQASLLRYEFGEGDAKGTLIFSSPQGNKREKLTVWISEDDGKTWAHQREVFAGAAAYSDLIALPNNQVGLLCEIGVSSSAQTITFITFPLAWISEK